MNDRRPTDAAGESWRKWGAGRSPPNPLTLVEDQERPLIWIGGERLDRKAYEVGRFDGHASRPIWRRIVALVVATFLAGVLIGRLIVPVSAATPRTVQPVIPAASSRESGAEGPASGNPAGPSGAPPAVRGSLDGVPTPSPAASQHESPATRTGIASWYHDRSLPASAFYAAARSWRWGERPYQVRVCRLATCIVVTVRDHCGCPDGRLTDLSPEAFRRLAPLSAGLVRVGVEGLR